MYIYTYGLIIRVRVIQSLGIPYNGGGNSNRHGDHIAMQLRSQKHRSHEAVKTSIFEPGGVPQGLGSKITHRERKTVGFV